MNSESVEPFATAAEVWFWSMACHQAGPDAARVAAGLTSVAEPSAPNDIHRIVGRLYHTRPAR